MDQNIKPLILITNDDGIQAKGIQELIEAIKPLGDIVVLAPDGPRSGMSSSITSAVPLRVTLKEKKDNITIYTSNGTPTDCVKLGINEILERKPDLLISGINHGSNSAICIVYSGTMGAAIEGCIFGVPSIGVSLTDHSPDADFTEAAHYAKVVAKKVLMEGLPKGVCLNVNVPNTDEIKGMKICTQAKGQWVEEFYKSQDAHNKEIYWLTGRFDNEDPNDTNTDEWALGNGYVSVVPSKIDMTSHETVHHMKHWELCNEKLKIKN